MKNLGKGILFISLLTPSCVMAAESLFVETLCTVRVRLLQGSQRVGEELSPPESSNESLSDVQSQLEPLPFLRYQEISSQTQRIANRGQGTFRHKLEDGSIHTMYVSPSVLENDTIGMTVRWSSSDGDELLSTQIRLPNGENVVLGTEHLEGSSSIVCIRVNCDGEIR